MQLSVSGNNFESEQVRIIIEAFGSFGLQTFVRREQNSKSAEKNSLCKNHIFFGIKKKKCCQKFSEKLNLNIETRHTIMQSFFFSVYLASVRKKETQNVMIEENFLIESKVWTGCVVRQKMRSNTKTNHTQDKTMRTKGVFLEKWIENMALKDNGYNKEELYLLTDQCFLLSAL